ncbi:MAG: hypothetical protein ACFFAU_07835 [Candidatus Hodarchaeota archaeon]
MQNTKRTAEYLRNQYRFYLFYILMLVTTVAHIFEEIIGNFWILEVIGLEIFLLLNWLLFCIPFLIFYFVLLEKRYAYKLSIIFVIFMGIQGIGHNLGTLITGSYYSGFAGGYTGVVFIFLSIPSIYYILKTMPQNMKSN